MPWQLKSYPEIYDNMKATFLARFPGAKLSDRGVINTLIHAASLQDAEQYLQMARVLDAFDLNTSRGSDLDRKAFEFDVSRRGPRPSFGYVTVSDANFSTKVEGSLSVGAGIGTTIITLQAGEGSLFVAGVTFPFSIIFDRDNASRETKTVVNRTGDQLVLSSPTTIIHAISASVIRSTVASDRTISSGTETYVPETPTNDEISFFTQETVVLLDGDVSTDPIPVESSQVGATTVVGAGRINTFRTRPFDSALVTNSAATSYGRDLETDDELRQRVKIQIQSLHRGTKFAIIANTVGVEDPISGREVLYAQVDEPIGMGASTLWIDDGSGTLTNGSTSSVDPEVMVYNAEGGEKRSRLVNWPLVNIFPAGPWFYKSSESGTATAVGVATLTDTSKAWVVNDYAGWLLVDDSANLWIITANTATQLTGLVSVAGAPSTPSLGNYSIADITSPALTIFDTSQMPFTQPTTEDVLINYSTGEIELNPTIYPSGLTAKNSLVCYPDYLYMTGLLQEVAHVIEGDPANTTQYPGVKAAGTLVKYEIPTTQNISFYINIRVSSGSESDYYSQVKDLVIQYVNALGIGENVILSEVLRRIKTIPSLYDVAILNPTSNVVILTGTRPHTDASLITVV